MLAILLLLTIPAAIAFATWSGIAAARRDEAKAVALIQAEAAVRRANHAAADRYWRAVRADANARMRAR